MLGPDTPPTQKEKKKKLKFARLKAFNGLGMFAEAVAAAKDPMFEGVADVALVAPEVAKAREGLAAARKAEAGVWGKGLGGGKSPAYSPKAAPAGTPPRSTPAANTARSPLQTGEAARAPTSPLSVRLEGGTGTMEAEAEAEESTGLSAAGWGIAAVAVGALGVAGYFALKAWRGK